MMVSNGHKCRWLLEVANEEGQVQGTAADSEGGDPG